MTADIEQDETVRRQAFDLFEGYALSSVLASFEMTGLLPALEGEGLDLETITGRGTDAVTLARACLDYLRVRGVVERDGRRHTLTPYGRTVCADKGYLVWLVGGYGEPLRRLDAFLSGEKRYGTHHPRDGRWVADGAAMLGRADVVPHAMSLLESIAFRHVLDLGCGNARFLLNVCSRFGASGTGVDISPEACAEAEKSIKAAGQSGKVGVVRGDAGDLAAITQLAETDLVVTFFLLHEILASGREALVDWLRALASRLPDGAHLLAAEVEPPVAGEGRELFTPEFTLVHALMRQRLISGPEWRDALTEGGFQVRRLADDAMPGGILVLAQKAAS